MPKKELVISDFSGGLNCYSDARDIEDNQFAQNWNASLDKYGVIRFTGAGEKHIINHPHSNTNFVPGGGLFSYSSDYSTNIIDSDFDRGIETGTVQAYSEGATSLTLAASPTYVSTAQYARENFFINMYLYIYERPGEGQGRRITLYDEETQVVTLQTAFGHSDDDGALSGSGSTSVNGVNQATLNWTAFRVYASGAGNNLIGKRLRFRRVGENEITAIQFISGTSTPAFNDVDNPANNYWTIGVEQTAVATAADIVAVLNSASNTYRIDVRAVVQNDIDGNATIVTVKYDTKGFIALETDFGICDGPIHSNPTIQSASANPMNTIDIFKPWFNGRGNAAANQLLKFHMVGHALKVGEIVTIAGTNTSGSEAIDIDGNHEVVYVETDYFYAAGTNGTPGDVTSVVFESSPTTASKYKIFPFGTETSTGGTITNFNYGVSKVRTISNQPIATADAYKPSITATINGKQDSYNISGTNLHQNLENTTFFSSEAIATGVSTLDLGRSEYPANSIHTLNLDPGVEYKLSFDMKILAAWNFFTSDGADADVLPGVLIFSPTAGVDRKGNSTSAVLMADGNWISSHEPITSNEHASGNGGIAPFTNVIDNGDFGDIVDTTINTDGNISAGAATLETTTWASATAADNLILFDGTSGSGTTPIGVVTDMTDDDTIQFSGATDNDVTAGGDLYKLDGWKAVGGDIEYTRYLNSDTTFIHNDGGYNGAHTLKMSSTGITNLPTPTNYLYQEVELDGNCYYDLKFKYLANHEDVINFRYQVYDKESNSALNPNGAWEQLDKTNYQLNSVDPTYEHNSEQVFFKNTLELNPAKFRFFVHRMKTESDSRTISIRFMFQGANSETDGNEVYLSCVTLTKAFPNIRDMGFPYPFLTQNNISSTGAINPFANAQWQDCELNFKVPSNFANKTDWKIIFFNGRYGYTTASPTTETSSSSYSPIQSVALDNLMLSSNASSDIILLNDNTSTGSNIYAYDNNADVWNMSFASWEGLNAEPIYTYVNGILQISDANFNNNNKLLYYFHYDRMIDNNSESGFHLTNNPLNFISDVVATQTGEGLFHTVSVKDCHKNLWRDYKITLSVAAGHIDSESFVAGTPPTDWHYEWFDWGIALPGNYLNEIGGTEVPWSPFAANTIPVKYLGGWTLDVGDADKSSIYDNHHRFDTLVGFQSTVGDWEFGGSEIAHALADENLDEQDATDGFTNSTTYNQWYNNPIYLIINGSGIIETDEDGGGGSMTQSLLIQSGYETTSFSGADFGKDGGSLYIKSIQFNPVLCMQGYDYAEGDSSGEGLGTHINAAQLPNVEATIYKDTTLVPGNENGAYTSSDLDRLFDGTFDVPQALGETQTFNLKTTNASTLLELAEQELYTDEITEGTQYDYNHYEGEYHEVFKYWQKCEFNFNIPAGEDGALSHLTSQDNIIIKLELTDPSDNSDYFIKHVGVMGWDGNAGAGNEHFFGFERPNRPHHLGWALDIWNVSFFKPDFTSEEANVLSSQEYGINLSFHFGTPEGSFGEEFTTSESWTDRRFKIGCTTVNIFDEESAIVAQEEEIGEDITLNQAPTLMIGINNRLAYNTLIKKVKVYMKDNESDIWYLQAFVDTRTFKMKSSTSGKTFSPSVSLDIDNVEEGDNVVWELPRENMLNFNEIDSYESESLVQQKDSSSNNTLTCRYKTSVHCNNRLYVGNIKQNGKHYGDRMLKTPVGKYNIFPASNYIDVAINDGDDITGLAYYKDKILQFKKRKVFIINVSGDYEYLEDTFDNIGVKKQCQITITPYGVVWVNSNGCFLYDGKDIKNLIDNKIGTESFQSQPTGTIGNYWAILSGYNPSVGYVKSTKKLIIPINVGSIENNQSQTTSNPEGFTYDFQSKGWTFLFKKLTGADATTSLAPGFIGFLSNFINDKDGNLLFYSVDAPGDGIGLNAIYKWNDDSVTSASSAGVSDILYIRTKDYDVGSPGVRKKIYKVYVTFKSTNAGSAAHSKILVKYGVNGVTPASTFTDDSTNYTAANGLSDGASSADWITAELKPSSSINNVYSFALLFVGAATNIADGFEINDITIVYRIKNIK